MKRNNRNTNTTGAKRSYISSSNTNRMSRDVKKALQQIKENKVSEINLSNKGVRNFEIEKIADALKTNTNLKKIDLSYNPFSYLGAQHLAKALQTNKTLEIINIEGIGIKGSEVPGLRFIWRFQDTRLKQMFAQLEKGVKGKRPNYAAPVFDKVNLSNLEKTLPFSFWNSKTFLNQRRLCARWAGVGPEGRQLLSTASTLVSKENAEKAMKEAAKISVPATK